MIFIETTIFTKLLPKYLNDVNIGHSNGICLFILTPAISFVEAVEFARLDGLRKAKGKAVG